MLFAVLFLITTYFAAGDTSMLQVESVEDNDSEEADSKSKLKSEQNDTRVENSQQLDELLNCRANWKGALQHPKSCSSYYLCEDGKMSLFECAKGMVFDAAKSECSTTATCEKHIMSKGNYELCQRQVDGLYPNYNESCRHYFRCQGTFNIGRQTCPIGQAFSFSRQTCLPEHHVSCVQPICHPQQNDFYWLPGSFCRSYYYCDSGTPYIFICPEGKVFDKVTQDCRAEGQCYEPICTGKSDGEYPDSTHDCRRYMQCTGGSLRAVNACPPGQQYYKNECRDETQAVCDDVASTALSVESVRDDCNGYSDGPHVIVASKCRRYQICQDGKALARMECPLGQIFNGQSCILPTNDTQCDDACEGKIDGYHADNKEGCRKYHFCRDGRTIERRSCPDGSLFSGRMCLPKPLVTCEQSLQPLENPCLGLSDGFHADYLKGCSDYYYCSEYRVVLQTSCIDNTIWNGKNCVHAKDTICLGPAPNTDCHGLTTGLYQDLASACTKYYYCHNGNKTELVCPKGSIFDGETCVNEDEYTCPSREPNSCYNKTDGYRMDIESGCRSYYYCSNNEKITYVCPNEQVFNGSTCVSFEYFKCPYTSYDCHFRADGYYPSLQSSCRKYFYCRNGYKLSSLNCGSRKVFDGTRCVVTTQPSVICRLASLQLSKENCEKNTPMQDLESQCKRYYYCADSRRQKASCPHNQVFNGERCVPSHTYVCPSDVRWHLQT